MTLIFAAVILTSGAALALWLHGRARRAEALADVREAALDSLAHDLRTPLTAILGAATALESLDASLSPDKRVALAATAAAGARELDHSIQALLEARRGADGRADLRACAQAALRRLDGALDGHAVEVRIPSDAAFAAADPALLELALANLIGNAARHGPAGGKIGVESRARRGAIILSVSDEGAGPPARTRARLLRGSARETRRTPGGAGLGLGVARGFAVAMGGDLRFSKQGVSRTEIVLKPAPALSDSAPAGDNTATAPVGRHG